MANKLHNLFMSKFLPSKIRTFWRTRASLRAQMVKNLPTMGRPGFDPWVGKIPWRRKWQPTPVFLPGEFHGQRSMVAYSPWGRKESDTTQWVTLWRVNPWKEVTMCQTLLNWSSLQPYETSLIIIISILQRNKLSHRQGKWPAQGHSASE